MGCSSGRQPPAPVLHPDLDYANETNTLPQDSENQGLNGLRGESEEDAERDLVRPPQTLPTLERLAQATGGTEKSWYRCVFPFGVISLVIGMAGTGVTFKFNTLPQTKVVSVALLCVGAVMLLVAVVCWRAHRLKRRKKKEGGFFTADQGTLDTWNYPDVSAGFISLRCGKEPSPNSARALENAEEVIRQQPLPFANIMEEQALDPEEESSLWFPALIQPVLNYIRPFSQCFGF
ncbi:hypothetical protein WMY93_010021 [Mugilogobius chulae]|uniref:Transmembrane protein 100 n=1 Tax=Mugilogobius chulae TaxID=88201 RepID=A0AAW0PF70_9GOBI